MNISRIGIDLAKNVFQLNGVDRRGWQMLLRFRNKLKEKLENRLLKYSGFLAI